MDLDSEIAHEPHAQPGYLMLMPHQYGPPNSPKAFRAWKNLPVLVPRPSYLRILFVYDKIN